MCDPRRRFEHTENVFRNCTDMYWQAVLETSNLQQKIDFQVDRQHELLERIFEILQHQKAHQTISDRTVRPAVFDRVQYETDMIERLRSNEKFFRTILEDLETKATQARTDMIEASRQFDDALAMLKNNQKFIKAQAKLRCAASVVTLHRSELRGALRNDRKRVKYERKQAEQATGNVDSATACA
jgi:hypothetical protein